MTSLHMCPHTSQIQTVQLIKIIHVSKSARNELFVLAPTLCYDIKLRATPSATKSTYRWSYRTVEMACQSPTRELSREELIQELHETRTQYKYVSPTKIEGASVVTYSCIQFRIQRRNLRHYRDCEDKLFDLKEVMMLKEDLLKRKTDCEKMEETILQQKEQIENQEKINQLEQELTEIKEKYTKLLDVNWH